MNQANEQETSSSFGPMLLSFLAGAAVGSIVVALTTPKSGPQLRRDLKALGINSRRKAGELVDEAKERTALAGCDLSRGIFDAAQDLCGKREHKESKV